MGVLRYRDSSQILKLPVQCLITQFAFYDDLTKLIRYDHRISELMDSIDLEALRVHEDVYRTIRWRMKKRKEILDGNLRKVRSQPRSYYLTDGYYRHTRRLSKFKSGSASAKVRSIVGRVFLTSNLGEDFQRELKEALFVD